MGRVTKARDHVSREEIEALLRSEQGLWETRKLLVILNAMVDPRPAKEIALHMNVSVHSVHLWMSVYNRNGLDALFGPGPGGRHNAHMSVDEEKAFLEPFFERAAKGDIATRAEIHEALEEHLLCTVHQSVVYTLLHRNGWRRIKPRPSHVKSNPEEQEAFKKKNSQLK